MTRPLQRSWRTLGSMNIIAAASVLALAILANPSASAAQHVSFGDSFTSGFGLSDAASTVCAQSQAAWPRQVNSILGITSPLVFGACSGASTFDIYTNGPLVVSEYQPAPQISLLPPPEYGWAGLLTVQVGGNDIKLGETLQQCRNGLNGLKNATNIPTSITALSQLSPGCASLDWLLTNFGTVVEQSLEPNLRSAFGKLRAAAPNAWIFAVGYPHLVNTTSSCRGIWSLVPLSYRQRMNLLADAINTKIERAAAASGIGWITGEVINAFADREACSSQELINSFNMHPNQAGHAMYGQVVARAVLAASSQTAAFVEETVPTDEALAGEDIAIRAYGSEDDDFAELPPAEGDDLSDEELGNE